MLSNDQLTFEDAIVKFFNSSEVEDKALPRTGKDFETNTEVKKEQ
jgi:hypothetical protein